MSSIILPSNGVPPFPPDNIVVSKQDPIFECKIGNGKNELTISILKSSAYDVGNGNVKNAESTAPESIKAAKVKETSVLSEPCLLGDDITSNVNNNISKTQNGQNNDTAKPRGSKQVNGVVCMIDEDFCYIYWKDSAEELSIPRALTDKEQIRKGNWLALTLEEMPEGIGISAFAKVDDCFKTMPLSDTILVQAEVDVPAVWGSKFHTDTAMTSDISLNVFDRNSLLVAEAHKGRRVSAVLRYSYTAGDMYGVWIIANVLG